MTSVESGYKHGIDGIMSKIGKCVLALSCDWFLCYMHLTIDSRNGRNTTGSIGLTKEKRETPIYQLDPTNTMVD